MPVDYIPDITLKDLERDGRLLEKIYVSQRTHEQCKTALENNPNVIKLVPLKYLCENNYKLVRDALQKDGNVFAALPDDLQTEEFWQIAKDTYSNLWPLERLTQASFDRYFTKKLIEESHNKESVPSWFLACPEKFTTLDHYIRLLHVNYLAIKLCPRLTWLHDSFDKLHDLFMEVLKIEPDLIELFPTHYDFALIAVHKNGNVLDAVSESIITQELCDIAMEQTAESFTAVPDKFKNYKMCLRAVSQSKYAFRRVPAQYRTGELQKINKERVDRDYTDLDRLMHVFRAKCNGCREYDKRCDSRICYGFGNRYIPIHEVCILCDVCNYGAKFDY